jgi:RNA polymerase sigma-70 factor (ECF subfamily)
MIDKAKKAAYFNRIIADNEKTIRRVIFFYCSDKQLMNDLYQEIITNIWESLDSFQGKSQISTWIYRITLNVSILHNKRNTYNKQTIYFSSISEFENFFSAEKNNGMIEKLYALIEQLNAVDKALMFLYLDKRSHKEIAEIMGLSVTNIGTKINRIVKKLKEINEGIDYEEY